MMSAEEMLFDGAHFAHIAARNEFLRRERIDADNLRSARYHESRKVEAAFHSLREVFA